jgi:TonB family protein
MPRENRKGFYLLNHMYDFSQPGVYTFQAKLRNQKTGQIIASNIVAITVVAGCTSFGALEYSAPVYSVSTDTRTPAGTVKSGQELSSCGIQQKKACAPLLVNRVVPKYTVEALQAELAGSAVLDFVVDDRGSTANVRVRESLDKGLDEQAVAAVKQWKFKPAIYKGGPFPVTATAALEFGCKAAKFPLNFTAGP